MGVWISTYGFGGPLKSGLQKKMGNAPKITSEPVYLCYFRQKQLLDFFGVHYPYVAGVPHLYTLCKEGEEKGKTVRAVLYLNLHEDEEEEFTVHLDKEYESVEAYGVDYEVCGKELFVKSVVPAYGAFVLVLKGE